MSQYVRVKLELTVVVDASDELDLAQALEPELRRFARDYNDGRFPFPVEQVRDGITRCVLHAWTRYLKSPAPTPGFHSSYVEDVGELRVSVETIPEGEEV